ncbi:thymidylate synthase (FAD) [Candidatus Heimdallarchaeota archaeon B3_Heim]|nr:MAG: thymidylate synthase (FAD) [Candidatus Heimdallarchaeota archaeon B3_Heim]
MDIELIQVTGTKGIIEGMKTSRRKSEIENIPQKVFSWGHWSVLEHSSITVKISNISRASCYDEATQVLTSCGWKNFFDLRKSDDMYTLNSNNHTIELHKPSSIIQERYKGKMYSLKSSKIDLLVTPNHRMYIYPFDTQRAKKAGSKGRGNPSLWEIRTASEIIGKRKAYKKTGKLRRKPTSTVRIKGMVRKHGRGNTELKPLKLKTNDFLEFLGYYLSEGNIHHSNGSGYDVVLHQGNEKIRNKMYNVIKRLGFKPRIVTPKERVPHVRTSSYQLYHYLKKLGKAKSKFIPRDILNSINKEQANILLNSLMEGDGSKWHGAWRYYTISEQLADDVQELTLLAGLAANIAISDRSGKGHRWKDMYIKYNYPSYVVKILTRQNNPLVNTHGKINDTWVDYDGNVFCVTVPNGILYVRRNGVPVWCGNSHQLVRHRVGNSYTQESQRYFDPLTDPDWYVIPPRIKENNVLLDKYRKARKEEANEYRLYRENGIPKEDARFCLPNACKTVVTWTFNMSSLIWFLEMRKTKAAQWEIRILAEKIYDLVMSLPEWAEFLQNWEPGQRR